MRSNEMFPRLAEVGIACPWSPESCRPTLVPNDMQRARLAMGDTAVRSSCQAHELRTLVPYDEVDRIAQRSTTAEENALGIEGEAE
ncbi:MAG: hypothetical protein ACI8QS_001748 [Planctomycetota bacterium]|jgi:hypothetical protein